MMKTLKKFHEKLNYADIAGKIIMTTVTPICADFQDCPNFQS